VEHISLALDSSGRPYVAYADYANDGKASMMRYNGSGWEQVGLFTGKAYSTSLALDSFDRPYLAYTNADDGSRVYVMRCDGMSCSLAGTIVSAGAATDVSLALDSANRAYVAYSDGTDSGKIKVMKLVNLPHAPSIYFWEQVGTGAVSPDAASATSLALDSSDTPYVTYTDWGNSGKASVMRFNGTNWVQVGPAGFSADVAYLTRLAFESGIRPYVAYEDAANDYKVSVMRFDGKNWEQVGVPGFSSSVLGEGEEVSLALDRSGRPYVAYTDNAADHKASVMRFNGTSWEQVGAVGFSASSAWFTSLALDRSGTPFVAYSDGANGEKASVMKFVADPVLTPVYKLLLRR
jgi:hypothetical protein